MKNTFIKAITLILFVSLITGFVAYKSGYIGTNENLIQWSPNGSVIKSKEADSLKQGDSVKQPKFIIPSSKSMVLPENPVLTLDTGKIKVDTTKKEIQLIPSSKSALIMPIKKKVDSTNKKKQNRP